MKYSVIKQCIPLILTIVTFTFLWTLLYGFLLLLNLFPFSQKLDLSLRFSDIFVGLTIYLKTAIDFAIFIGNLMEHNSGWKKRIAIELGTALGNAVGTLAILLVWNFFREVPILMVVMIVIASLVLFRMAEESLSELKSKYNNLKLFLSPLDIFLRFFNTISAPLLSRITPEVGIINVRIMPFVSLLFFSFTIPFILGLDDFAGYIPLFSVINVYGFALGVFLGHMLLNLALFLSPKHTVLVVKSPFVLLLGGLAFIGIGLWGFFEALRILFVFF